MSNLVGKKVRWEGREYTILEQNHKDENLVMVDDEHKSVIHLKWDDVDLKDLNYYKLNAEEDYITTPISVLRYIGELERAVKENGLI